MTEEERKQLSNHMARLGAGLLLLKEKMEAPIRRPLSYADRVTFEFEGRQYLIVSTSLLDSHADPRPYGNQHYPYCARHEGGNYNATLACTCYDYPLVAATAMHNACVEKVKEMRDRFQRAADSSSLPNDLTASRDAAAANALTRLLAEMESLTLEQEKW